MAVDALQIGRRYWWVNQNQTYHEELRGGFVWSPKRNKNGARNPFYDTMLRVEPGDLVFSFRKTLISDVGVVQGLASTAAQPAFRSGSDSWSDDGWLVPVEFEPVERPLRPKDHIEQLRHLLPEKYSPLRTTGDGLQSVYLAEVGFDLAMALLDLLKLKEPVLAAVDLDAFEPQIEWPAPSEPPTTETEQLVLARRGQGIFKANLRLLEDRCRLTGTTDIRHLRASHIKPWSVSTSAERIDGANGLLLAPHVDHLFDRGWVTFATDGALLRSADLDDAILDQWNLRSPAQGIPLTERQDCYMQYHRQHVYRSPTGSASVSLPEQSA